MSDETDLRWIDARYQIADCLTKHASKKSESVLHNIFDESQWMITAEEDMLDKSKQEREDRNNSSGSEEMPNVEFTYVVMDESHGRTDHVGRTRLAKFCGSRDDSLSWNLSRVKQDDAIRADDMDHKTGGNSGNTTGCSTALAFEVVLVLAPRLIIDSQGVVVVFDQQVELLELCLHVIDVTEVQVHDLDHECCASLLPNLVTRLRYASYPFWSGTILQGNIAGRKNTWQLLPAIIFYRIRAVSNSFREPVIWVMPAQQNK